MPNIFFTPILNPPLSSTSTRTSGSPIRFYASVQVTADSTVTINPEEKFTLVLLHSTNGRGVWKPALFREVTEAKEDIVKLFDIQEKNVETSSSGRNLFVLDLEYDCGQGPLQFCLNYRFSDGPWLRAGSRIGGADGRIVFQTAPESPTTLSEIFSPEGGIQNWQARLVKGDCKESTHIWDIAHTTAVETDILEIPMGKPRFLEQWMALVKIAPPWMGPLHGKTSFDISKDALLVVFQRSCDGRHVVILPVSGLGSGSAYVTSCPSGSGSVVIRGMDDSENSGRDRKVQVIVAAGNCALETVSAAVGYLKKLVMGSGTHGNESVLTDEKFGLELVDKRRAWEDGISYCTWNGLGSNLSEVRIIGALKELEKAGIKVGNLIVDDNWQSISGSNYTSSGTLSSFEANENFPEGLKGLVGKIRARFPYIKHIGVWHALHGYWDGITPGGSIGKTYKTVEVVWRDNVNSAEKMLTVVAPEDVERFYDDFFKFLNSCGVDSVKTDVQCRIDELKNGRDKAKLARAYQDAFKKSSIKYFDQRVIYCMAHVPQILYHSLLPDDNKPVFFRSSDDFYPNIPQTHSWHVFTNAMNMVLFSQLNILPDWDMFQSSLPTYNSLHAAARCLSGGPIFLTDIPSEHDTALINSMTSPSPADYTSRALRPSGMAMASDPYLAYHSSRLLQVRNKCENASLMGVFNVSTVTLTELVDMKTGFQSLDIGKEYVIRAHSTGRVTEPRNIVGGDGDSLLVVELEPSKWEVFAATAIETVQVEEGVIKIAVLGIKENITGAAAVLEKRVYKGVDGKGVVIQVDVCALGVLVVYISDITQGRTLEQVSVNIGGKASPEEAYSFLGSTLEIDLLKMGASEGYGGEGVITASIELAYGLMDRGTFS